MEQQVERYGTSQYLGQVTGGNGEFAHQPVGPTGPLGIPVAAASGEILPGHHAQSGGDNLHEKPPQAAQPDPPKEPVFERSPPLQVCSPVPGVHVADSDQNRGPNKSPPL